MCSVKKKTTAQFNPEPLPGPTGSRASLKQGTATHTARVTQQHHLCSSCSAGQERRGVKAKTRPSPFPSKLKHHLCVYICPPPTPQISPRGLKESLACALSAHKAVWPPYRAGRAAARRPPYAEPRAQARRALCGPGSLPAAACARAAGREGRALGRHGQASRPRPRRLRCLRWQRDSRGLGGAGAPQPRRRGGRGAAGPAPGPPAGCVERRVTGSRRGEARLPRLFAPLSRRGTAAAALPPPGAELRGRLSWGSSC